MAQVDEIKMPSVRNKRNSARNDTTTSRSKKIAIPSSRSKRKRHTDLKNSLASDRGLMAASNYATVKAVIVKTISPRSRKTNRQSTIKSSRNSSAKGKESGKFTHRRHKTQIIGLDLSNKNDVHSARK